MNKKINGIKFKNILLTILFIVLLSFLFYYLFLSGNEVNNTTLDNQKNNSKEYIIGVTDHKEANPEVIKEVFAEGMDYNDFIKAITKKDNYIKSNGNYEELSFNFERNLRYTEVEDYLYKLNNSDIVSLEIIGTSFDNRNLYSVEIGKGSKTFMVDGNTHSAEIAGTYFLLKFAIDMVNKYEKSDNETIEILNNIKFVFVPSVNPDGFEVNQFGIENIKNHDSYIYQLKDKIDFSQSKSNANGVDLNRNYPTQTSGLYYNDYEKIISSVSLEKTYKRFTYFGGYSMGSETETKAMIYWMSKHYKNTFSFITIHSAGRVIYTGKPNLSDEYNKLCDRQGKIIKNATKYVLHGLSHEEVGEGNDGTTSDFMAEIAHGFKYSKNTNKLTKGNYKDKETDFKYKYCATVLETLANYSKNMQTIKEEYIYRNIDKMFLNIINELGIEK